MGNYRVREMVMNSVGPWVPACLADVAMDSLVSVIQRLCHVQSAQGHLEFGRQN